METSSKVKRLLLCPIFLSVFLTLSFIFTFVPVSYGHTADDSESVVDAYSRERIADKGIPGIAVVIVRDGQITFLAGYGVTSVEDPSPVTPKTIFDLASCSKSFTALAILLLEKDGLIDLDLSVVNYLPKLRFADPGVERTIKIRDLLNHTSGLPGVFSEPLAFHQGEDAMTKLVIAMNKVHLNRPVGSSFEYSNMNYSLLGTIIENASKKKFEECMQERIFSPLGMKNTTLYPEVAAGKDRASGHQLRFGQILVSDIEIYRSAAPAGWVLSTAEDMGKWLLMQLDGGKLDDRQVIPDELILESHAPAVKYVENNEQVSYGTGWLSTTSPDGTRVIWHGGDTPNFVAEMILVPEFDFGISMLVNGQTNDHIHDIAVDIVNLELGTEVVLPDAPWWASWASIDRIAAGALGLSFIFLVGLVIYLYRNFKSRHKVQEPINDNSVKQSILRIWNIALPTAPLALIAIGVAAAFVFVQFYLGFNIFKIITRFGGYAPPGVMISAVTLLIVICLWALALAGTTLLRLTVKSRKYDA
ncbi:MAG: beta-lactamase family protein [Dehalococcoidales bacterium]|nr:MAG: beta-lactamase family protein [Dehalococcoidales bacterium]